MARCRSPYDSLRKVVLAAAARGLRPYTMPDFSLLSVGGVHSVGGGGILSPKRGQFLVSSSVTFCHSHPNHIEPLFIDELLSCAGFVVQNALQLTVVTGRCDIVTCSPTQRASLFNSVLGGLGQVAVVVSARIPLELELRCFLMRSCEIVKRLCRHD